MVDNNSETASNSEIAVQTSTYKFSCKKVLRTINVEPVIFFFSINVSVIVVSIAAFLYHHTCLRLIQENSTIIDKSSYCYDLSNLQQDGANISNISHSSEKLALQIAVEKQVSLYKKSY